jgi:hypothetical protein
VFAFAFGTAVIGFLGTGTLYAVLAFVEPFILGTDALTSFASDTINTGSFVLAFWFMSGFMLFFGAFLGLFVLSAMFAASLVFMLVSMLVTKFGQSKLSYKDSPLPVFDKICPPVEYKEDP